MQVDADLSDADDGLYQLGLRVSCTDETYVSDTVSLVIDRTAPQVLPQSVLPPGRALTVGGAVGVSFSESVDCASSVVSASLSDGTVLVSGTHFKIICTADRMYIKFTAAQVHSLKDLLLGVIITVLCICSLLPCLA